MKQKQKIVVIVGPTASGKTGLAIALAKKINGEVISADSRQVYRGLDVGTVKVTKREMRGMPHHLLDVASPRRAARATTAFSASDFVRHADRAIADIARRGKVPIVAGGTGYYVDALLRRIPVPDVPPDAKLRKTLENLDAIQLHLLLKRLDPVRAKNIEKNNPRRLIRAIEIAKKLGKNPPKNFSKSGDTLYDEIIVGIAPPQKTLQKKIIARARRFEKAAYFRALIKETRMLREKYKLSWARINTLGFEYALAALHLRGELAKRDLPARLASLNLKYAKRQLRYFRRNPSIHWILTPSLLIIRDVLK